MAGFSPKGGSPFANPVIDLPETPTLSVSNDDNQETDVNVSMKKISKIILSLFGAILLCAEASFVAFAKDLEVCYHCGGTGQYQCAACHNTGSVVCDGCKGKKTFTCSGEEGKGKCKNGFYTCESCNGDGKCRTGDGEITEGVCGNCGGSGKKECQSCHGVATRACDRCGGKGTEECQTGDCKTAKAIGWKCPYCKGSGYILLGNPMPPASENDGVKNVPAKGDHIVTNNQTWAGYTYGESSAGEKKTDSAASSKAEPTGESRQTKTVSSVTQESGSSKAETPAESKAEPVSSRETTESEPEQQETFVSTFPLPEDRNTDFTIPTAVPEESAIRAVAMVSISGMSDEEQRYYAGLSDEELAEILQKVREGVETANPGKADEDTEKLLSDFAKQNGFDSLADGRIFPITFEKGEAIGFPVRVTVMLEQGELNGGSELVLYRITPENKIEQVGEAEYTTYEDGSVDTISFYTKELSTFFTVAKGGGTIAVKDPAVAPEQTAAPDTPKEETGKTVIPLIAAIVTFLAAALIVALLLIRKKKNNTKIKEKGDSEDVLQ